MTRRLHDDDQGVALVAVLGLSLVLALLLTALLQYGVGSLRQARYDQDWHAALAAANGGVDDFLSRINRDDDYWQEADQDAVATSSEDADNDALDGGFATIEGGTSQFSYEVDTTALPSTGVITVISDGRVNDVVRTVSATMRRRGFLDFLYFTEYETTDPVAYSASLRDRAAANCSRHRYDSPARNVNCDEIIWPTGDRVGGPFHSNDQLAITGRPQWDDRATTSMPNGTYYDHASSKNCLGSGNPSGCTSDPSFAHGLEFAAPLTLPPSNNQIKAQADPAISGKGCMYVGATFLRFNSNGSIAVKSAKTDDPSSSKCPINGRMNALPSNGVIYVRAAKAGETCLSGAPHPYNLSSDITAYDRCAGDVFIEGTLDGRLTLAAENNVVVTNDVVYAGGRSASSGDMLGLVANNFVEIMHPVRALSSQRYRYIGEIRADGFIRSSDCDTTSGGGRYCYALENDTADIRYLPGNRRFEDPHIDAAILSVGHSFRVQNHREGSAFSSPIDLFGTIGQQYRGPTGTFNSSTLSQITGYDKDYKYDPRLEYISPPHFLDPVQSSWSVRSFSEE